MNLLTIVCSSFGRVDDMALTWIRCDYLLGDIVLQQLAVLLDLVLHDDEGPRVL